MNVEQSVIESCSLRFAYPGCPPVLDGLDLTVAAGEFVCVLGHNGCGKTTLLKCLLGLLAPQGGAVKLDGKLLVEHSLRMRARLMAYVPQTPVSAFAFTARDLVLIGRLAHLGILGLPGRQDMAVAEEALRMTGTQALAERTLEELSGGEAQTVMIARALAQQPAAMLLDEPTSHLDLRNQTLIHRMLHRIAHEWPMAVLCVSHDINLAARFADRLVLLRAGRVLADGPPANVLTADNLRAAFEVDVELIPTGDGIPLVRVR